MKYDCEVIRDLLPLYADNACSGKSRAMVEEHLQECPDCRELVDRLLKTEIEDTLHSEKESVIEYGIRQFRRRTAIVGSAVSGAFMVPVLVIAIMAFVAGSTMNWITIVLAAFCVAASLIAVPVLVPEDKAFWTFCAFCASLMILLGAACIYTRGNWFWIASSAVLFGLSVIFLPFVIRARPLKKLIGESNRVLIVLGVDCALFFNMLNMISSSGRLTFNSLFFTFGIIAGVALVAYELFAKGKPRK